MNREQKRKSNKEMLKVIGGKSKIDDPSRPVTRGELIEIINQLHQNVGEVQNNLVEAVNSMYGNQVFPFQMELWAIEQLLIEKGIFTEEEVNVKLAERRKELLDRAQQIKEDEDGELKVVPKEEEIENEKKAIEKAKSNAKKPSKKK